MSSVNWVVLQGTRSCLQHRSRMQDPVPCVKESGNSVRKRNLRLCSLSGKQHGITNKMGRGCMKGSVKHCICCPPSHAHTQTGLTECKEAPSGFTFHFSVQHSQHPQVIEKTQCQSTCTKTRDFSPTHMVATASQSPVSFADVSAHMYAPSGAV